MLGRVLFWRGKKFKKLRLRRRANNTRKRTLVFIQKRPLLSIFIILGLLLLFIVIGSLLRQPTDDAVEVEKVKTVETYSIGEVPRAQFQAQIEKSGIVKIVAISGGIVSKIHVDAGQEVSQGKTLVSLSSNYAGGNVLSVQRELASASYNNASTTNELQKELITKQREIAEKTDANADELRQIAEDSLEANESLLEFNRGILDSLEDSLETLEASPEENSELIASTKQMISQFRTGTNQLANSVSQAEYETDTDNPPAQLSNLQRELTLKQLELQEKNLALALETSRLQLRLAQINEAVMFPSAPFAGVVERVHVKEGAYVAPGTALLTLHGKQTLQAIVKLPREIARSVSLVEPSTFLIGDETYEGRPFYVSGEATDGTLYSAQFSIPEKYQEEVTNLTYIPVEIPLGYPNTGTTIPFVPIESVFQTQSGDFIFIYEDGVVESISVELGTVSGQYVEVKEGLSRGDIVILSRNVVDGERVEIAR